MNGLEGITVATFLVDRLASDPDFRTALGVPTRDAALARIAEGVLPPDQPTVRPDGSPFPWVTFTIVEPQDVRVVGLAKVLTAVQFQVKVTAATETYAALADVAAAVNARLDAVVNPPTHPAVATCERLSGVHYPENANGVQYRHLGGLFQAYVQNTT
jgi:hypothetical protein